MTTLIKQEVERIGNEVGVQSDLISQIQAALAGKAVTEADFLAMRCMNTLTEYSSNEVTSVGQYAFYGSSRLTSINFPNATAIGTYSFAYCFVLTDIDLPAATNIASSAFNCCYDLAFLDLPCATSIGTYAFASCGDLSTLVLRSSTVCTLASTSAFNSTPFASGGTGGTVYVPSALIASYRAASNWSTLYNAGSCTFAAIEGSEYE